MNRQRQKEKTELLEKIVQQRQALAEQKIEFLDSTTRIDAICRTLVAFKPVVVAASGVVAIWTLRHPRRLGRWAKHGISLWSGWRMLRDLIPR